METSEQVPLVKHVVDPITEETMLKLVEAARAIKKADFILLTSGAGLGVDSGLPDFRGPEGFWRAYPPMQKLGLRFEQMSTPSWFTKDPNFAWGFWGHRFGLYFSSKPHQGYHTMLKWAKSKKDYFVFTSNVDTHWITAGTPETKVNECHGSVGYLQCSQNCSRDLWNSHIDEIYSLRVDLTTFRAEDPLPSCIHCHKLARPNVLMFGDFFFNPRRENDQSLMMDNFEKRVLEKPDAKLVVIEIGAGNAVPTVRQTSEQWSRRFKGKLIRINLRDDYYPESVDGIGIPLGGLRAVLEIDALMEKMED